MGPFQERNFFFFWTFFDPKKSWLCHYSGAATPREGTTWTNIWYCYTFLSIELSIFEPKHRGDRTILVYWYIWIFGYLDIWIFGFLTWSDHLRVWAQKCLARWRKWCSSSSFASRSSLPWESRHLKIGKVSFFLGRKKFKKKKVTFLERFLLMRFIKGTVWL